MSVLHLYLASCLFEFWRKCMTTLEFFIKELNLEAQSTRKILECVPDGKNDWAPHAKSMPLMRLAVHVAELPSWFGTILNTKELDFDHHEYKPEPIQNKKELLEYFDKTIEKAKEILLATKEETLNERWMLRKGDLIYVDANKDEFLRTSFNHLVHHRAQLGVYLRLLDIPIPGCYGPSADEKY